MIRTTAPLKSSRKTGRASLLAAVLLACAGSASALGLQQAFEAALKNDPTYRMNYYENEGAKENRIIGRSGLLPQVGANYSANRNRAELTQLNPITNKEFVTNPRYISRNATIQLRQPLFNLDAWARYQQALSSVNESAARFESNTAEVALRVVGAYVEALYAADQLASVKAQRTTYTEQMKVNQRLVVNGEGTKTDLLEIQARLDLVEAQVLEAEDVMRNTRQTLEGVIGMDAGTLEPLAPNFAFAKEPPPPFETWRAQALENNPELKAARAAIETAKLEILKQRAGHAPRLDFIASYGHADSETITTVDQKIVNRTVGVQLNIPLYQGGYVDAASRQAVAGLERAKANLDVKTNLVMTELRKAHNQAVSSVAKVGALVKATESGTLLTKATAQSIKGGVRINLDLLTAEQQLAVTERDLAQARYSYLISLLRMRAAAGTLTAADVREISAYFR